jgi:chromosome partitioning protein
MRRFRFSTLCHNAADRGEQVQQRLVVDLEAELTKRQLPDFGIERAAQLAGCSSNHIRALEDRGELPVPRMIQSGAIQRRIYNYNEINRIREVTEKQPLRPKGANTARVVFSNLKGGVGKTTMALHFAQYAAREGYRVLLVDADPQATTTRAFGLIPDLHLQDGEDLFPALTQDPLLIKTAVRKTYWDNLTLIPARLTLQYSDWHLSQPEERNNPELGSPPIRLHRALATMDSDWDLIVVDTPPALGMLSINAIAAANLIIMPISPHMYDISSSVQYFKILAQVCELYEEEINVERLALLLTKVDNTPETMRNIAVISGAYGELLLSNRMGQTKELQKSASDQMTIYEIEQPRGSKETYQRAIMMLDAVNGEILLAVRQIWQHQILEKIDTREGAITS